LAEQQFEELVKVFAMFLATEGNSIALLSTEVCYSNAKSKCCVCVLAQSVFLAL